jgi:N-acetylmuramic acid 6-phosphate etherase
MALPRTEMLHDEAKGLDARDPIVIARALAAGQAAAAAVVADASEAICAGAQAMAASIRAGGRLVYAAAGSSGLMAASDALELGGTFAIPPRQIRILMAGGMPTGVEMPGADEDATDSLARDLADLTAADTVITVSASGTTPFTLEAARLAQAKGAAVIGIANNAGSALLTMTDHPILLATPPEVVAGSTRMGAGTAQKIALNMLSTLMAVELGHIYDGMMVNVVADNDKLRRRAAGIVVAITGVAPDKAEAALAEARGQVKPAALIAAGLSPARADSLLEDTQGNLRAALARI